MARGNIIGVPNVPSQVSASGVWPLLQQFRARVLGIWPTTSQDVDYLLLAGGGGGGADNAGGGGGGGVVLGFESVQPAFAYTVTIGAGGNGATGSNTDNQTSGANSSIFGVTTLGGGFGASGQLGLNLAASGGSGGGGDGERPTNGGAGTSGQGFAGGNGRALPDHGGGGGGGGGVGETATSSFSGAGGPGLVSSLTGTSLQYGAGGGGGGANVATDGGGGGTSSGGGVRGTGSGLTGGGNGQQFFGGGGGGSGTTATTGGNGGTGVVLIRYANSFQDLLIGSGLQYRNSAGSTVNGTGVRVAPSYSPTGFKVYEIRGGTGNVEF